MTARTNKVAVRRHAIDTINERVKQGREQGYLLTIYGYCENSDCPAREVVMRIKDYDNALLRMIGNGMRCPVCQQAPLNVHHTQPGVSPIA